VFATATFASLDIAAFADAQFNATFRTEYKTNLAAAAVGAPVIEPSSGPLSIGQASQGRLQDSFRTASPWATGVIALTGVIQMTGPWLLLRALAVSATC
jgi:hypothetical protein